MRRASDGADIAPTTTFGRRLDEYKIEHACQNDYRKIPGHCTINEAQEANPLATTEREVAKSLQTKLSPPTKSAKRTVARGRRHQQWDKPNKGSKVSFASPK